MTKNNIDKFVAASVCSIDGGRMKISDGWMTNLERPRGYYSTGVFDIENGKIYDFSQSPGEKKNKIVIDVPYFLKKKHGLLEHDFYHTVESPCKNRNLKEVTLKNAVYKTDDRGRVKFIYVGYDQFRSKVRFLKKSFFMWLKFISKNFWNSVIFNYYVIKTSDFFSGI